MRLLDTQTLDLVEFHEPPRSYAILSHTWSTQEVSYQDLVATRAAEQGGHKKIVRSCRFALSRNYNYIWIDTCCIDKQSSSELSEAINSMYRWYEGASLCIAYLSDLEPRTSSFTDAQLVGKLERCRWFYRGWTLQELVAPRNLVFLSRDWQEEFAKDERKEALSLVTGIPQDILYARTSSKWRTAMASTSVAAKLSWASKRSTTRTEDMAYCLLGLFGVNMPLLYGEAEKAFIRLQEEIMKNSDDDSLFAWGAIRNFGHSSNFREPTHLPGEHAASGGLLATSPKHFENCGNIVHFPDSTFLDPYSLTNRGLRMTLRVRKRYYFTTENSVTPPSAWQGRLNCCLGDDLHHILAIWIMQEPGQNVYQRVGDLELVSETADFPDAQTMYFRKAPPPAAVLGNTLHIPWMQDFWVNDVVPREAFDPKLRLVRLERNLAIHFRGKSTSPFFLLVKVETGSWNETLAPQVRVVYPDRKSEPLALVYPNHASEPPAAISKWIEGDNPRLWGILGFFSTDWSHAAIADLPLPDGTRRTLRIAVEQSHLMGQDCFALNMRARTNTLPRDYMHNYPSATRALP